MNSPLSKLESLAGLVRNDGADTKPALLRVLTDFYVQKPVHTAEEDRHFTELALRLIAEVDRPTRKDIARRLADHGNVPLAVLHLLTPDLIDNACEHEPKPGPKMENSQSSRAEMARNASISDAASPASADPVHTAIPEQDRLAAAQFSDEFFAADPAQRRGILRELDSGPAVAPLGISAHEAAITCQNLEDAALRSRPYEFVLEMERALLIPRPVAQSIVNDLSGEPTLIIAKALGMSIDVLQRILLLVNPAVGTSVRRVFDLTELYHELSAQAALRMISLWRNSATPPSMPEGTSPRDSSSARRFLEDTLRFKMPELPAAGQKRDQRAS